jgi:hypothetical protein
VDSRFRGNDECELSHHTLRHSPNAVDSRYRGNDVFEGPGQVGLQPYRSTANRPSDHERKQEAEMLTSEGEA